MDATAAPPLPYKICVLVYVRDVHGRLLLMRRNKSPNLGLWSCIGGKLEQGTGESPFECARRETFEETGLVLADEDLHLWGMIAEKAYEGRTHFLMFLFEVKRPIEALPPPIDEGEFAFHEPSAINDLPIPETDRLALWPAWFRHRDAFLSLRADCTPPGPPRVTTEQR